LLLPHKGFEMPTLSEVKKVLTKKRKMGEE
jgi:hypothetical protein